MRLIHDRTFQANELTGPLLDHAVMLAQLMTGRATPHPTKLSVGEPVDQSIRYYEPSTNGQDFLPLLNRWTDMRLWKMVGDEQFTAMVENSIAWGPTAEIALCRAVVRAVFGEEVEL